MPSQWDNASDRDLLLAIMEDAQVKSIAWPDVVTKMQARGYTFTHEACRQHFQKLRKESKGGSASTAEPSTPKRTKATGNGPNSSVKKRKTPSKTASFATSNGQEDDDEEIDNTPVKKRKGNSVKKEEDFSVQPAPAFKSEKDATHVDLVNDDLYDDSEAEA